MPSYISPRRYGLNLPVNEFNHALNIFNSRERRFGKTSEQIQQKKLEN